MNKKSIAFNILMLTLVFLCHSKYCNVCFFSILSTYLSVYHVF